MRYKTREGVILTQICDSYYLVAAKALYGQLPYITEINETAAVCWKRMEHGASEEDLCQTLAAEYDVEDPSGMAGDIQGLLAKLKSDGYIEQIGEEGQNP